MFDDLKQVQPTDNTQQATPQQPAQPNPAPQTQGPVDDMFADTDPSKGGAEKPSAIQSGKMKPINTTSMPTPQPEVRQPMTTNADAMIQPTAGGSSPAKKIFIAIVVILVLAIAGLAIYYFMNRQPAVVEEIPDVIVNENVNTNEPAPPPVVEVETEDDDGDGLTNEEELAYQTDPLSPDTDNDGLFDREEVIVYNTNALLADTDGDGLTDYDEVSVWRSDPNLQDTDGDSYDDGTEVANGYDPLGPGMLPPPVDDETL